MKKIILYLAIVISTSNCIAQENRSAEIKGIVEDTDIHEIYLTHIDSSLQFVDSCEIRNGKFSFRIQPDKPDIYELYYNNGYYRIPIALEPCCKMEITVHKNNKTTVDVQYGEEEKTMQQLMPSIEEYLIALNYTPTDGKNNFEEILNKGNQKLAAEITQHSQNLAAIYALSSMLEVEDDLFFKIYESSIDTTSYSHSYYFKTIQNSYHTRKSNILVGNNAFDFEAKTINGDKFILSQLREKYVVLNFWASWCKPCREKNKEIAEYLHLSENENLVLVSFNLDEDAKAWKEASKNDAITWLNVSNGKGFKGNNILTHYKISQLPCIFLISPKGVILKQNRPFNEIISHD